MSHSLAAAFASCYVLTTQTLTVGCISGLGQISSSQGVVFWLHRCPPFGGLKCTLECHIARGVGSP